MRGKRRHVLVVDDDSVSRTIAQQILEACGFGVAVAADGVDALVVMAKRSFDLVLMDIEMPGLTGFDTTRLLRRAGHGLPVIAHTSLDGSDLLGRCLAAGMDDWLPKPCRREQLEVTLRRWLSASE